VKSNFRWIILAFSAAAFGGWACGSDGDGGGGGGGSNICDETSSAFDELACLECLSALTACTQSGMCSTEAAAGFACVMSSCEDEGDAVTQCEDDADEACADAHPDDFDAYFNCVEAACQAENAAYEACGQTKCAAEQAAIYACFERECPAAAACVRFF